ncbi:MAG: hypothetical protein GX800_05800 [Clostridiaceae bacterium]|jgi:hypothetical protein|nr:hypothetical protein [Clostridiaceae bacterium]
MRKRMLSLLVVLAMIIGTGAFNTNVFAEDTIGDFCIQYSLDGGANYISVPGCSEGTTSYNVSLPNDTNQVKLRVITSDGEEQVCTPMFRRRRQMLPLLQVTIT